LIPLQQTQLATRKEFYIYFLCGLIALYFIMSAAFDILFYHHDIYKYSTGSLHRACTGNQGHKLIVAIGRPGGAYLDCLNNKLGNTLESINHMRGLSLVLISAMLSLFAVSLRKLGFAFWTALFVSGAVFLLPITLTIVIMACASIIVSIILAFLANYYISQFDLEKMQMKSHYIVDMGFGVFLLLISFFTYPGATAFYLVPAAMLILFRPLSEWQKTKKSVIRDVLIYCLFSVIYFLIAKALQQSIDVNISQSYRFSLNTKIFNRVTALFQMLPKLWNLDAEFRYTVLIYGIITLGSLCGLKSFFQNKQVPIKFLMEAVFALLILLVLGGSVYLLAPAQGTPSSRVVFPFETITLLIVIWSVLKCCEWRPKTAVRNFFLASGSVCLIAAYYSNAILTMSVLNDYLELNVIVTAIANRIEEHEPIKRIHVIGSTQTNFTAVNPHEDIFSVNSTVSGDDTTNMVNTAFLRIAKRHTFDLTNCTFLGGDGKMTEEEIRCINSVPKGNIAVTYSHAGAPIYVSPDTLLISMNSPLPAGQKIDYNAILRDR
jgi:hypothetical protein